jgi:dolichyl-phosphate-mannose-protein mannosyltransferase
MSSPQGIKQRGKEGKKRGTTPQPDVAVNGLANGNVADGIEQLKQAGKETVSKEWDYKLALTVITILAFITRFWGISHPNQVVFDEVHFGKVS